MKLYLLILMFTVFLTGCSITGNPVPQDHFYRLPEVTIEPQESNSIGSLQLVSVTADGLYNERNLLYVDASRPLEVNRYHYHYWLESPLTLIGKYFANALKKSLVSNHFIDAGEKNSADVRMSVKIVRFERVISDSGFSVQVALLVTMDYTARKVERWQKMYKVDHEVDSGDMHDTASAFGDVLNSISQMLIRDLVNK